MAEVELARIAGRRACGTLDRLARRCTALTKLERRLDPSRRCPRGTLIRRDPSRRFPPLPGAAVLDPAAAPPFFVSRRRPISDRSAAVRPACGAGSAVAEPKKTLLAGCRRPRPLFVETPRAAAHGELSSVQEEKYR
jgi:hypothetical protein